MHVATYSFYGILLLFYYACVLLSLPCITGVQIAELMLPHSHDPNPVISTGSSEHNQRIERLRRDVFRCILSVYYQLFYHLEKSGLLDPLSDIDLYCLHAVYMHKINEALYKHFHERMKLAWSHNRTFNDSCATNCSRKYPK